MKCCSNCFCDFFFAEKISLAADETGKCSFCEEAVVDLISPEVFVDAFERFCDIFYKESIDPNACSLSALMRSDWGLFNNLDSAQADALVGAILPEANEARYVPVVPHDSSVVSRWKELRFELKHENRFFPQKMSFRKENEGRLFGYLAAHDDPPRYFYRARLLVEEESYDLADMGRPPCEITSSGRANPVGIPYLYVATDKNTAIAEIRPYKSARVCVATYELTEPLTFADLRNPKDVISPFLLVDDPNIPEEDLRSLRKYMPFLSRLGEELSKPVSPQKSHLEYLPSQYLCEFLKHSGFHGVIYKSSVGAGVNYAIFDDSSFRGIEVKSYNVDDVAFSIT